MAEEGAGVVVADINEAAGRETVELINEKGGRAVFVLVDLTSEEQVKNAFLRAREQFGPVSVLCNNAGMWDVDRDRKVTDFDEKLWAKIMEVNVKSMFLCAKYAVPQMLEYGKGSIVNVGSLCTVIGMREAGNIYSASKGGG
jgi:NAD(P)-dependent dehydrogenase (short-subunit alcohol dehydrogenase family)